MRNEPWSETADSNVLHTRRCGGAASCSQRDDSTLASSSTVVKHFRFGPSIVAREWVAARAVKAVGRAQRGRSGIKDARSALSGRVASRTMAARRPKITTWIHTRSPPPRCTNPTTTFPPETQTAWRERPPPWPQAWQATRSKMVVAHATVLPWTVAPTASNLTAGTERRPMRAFSKSPR